MPFMSKLTSTKFVLQDFNQSLQISNSDNEGSLRELDSRLSELSQTVVEARLKQYGLNEIARNKRQSSLCRLLGNVLSPVRRVTIISDEVTE